MTGASELDELGLDDLPAGAVTLLEWPDRAASILPPDRFDITFMLAPELGPPSPPADTGVVRKVTLPADRAPTPSSAPRRPQLEPTTMVRLSISLRPAATASMSFPARSAR